MEQKLKTRIDRAFQLTRELVEHLDEASLPMDLPGLPSNRIADQLWCVVGARESYLRAIRAGAWQGFACSLTPPLNKPAVLSACDETSRLLHEICFDTEARIELAFALLEHEVQHHGQLIRFVYGNRLTFPESWTKRYTVK